MYVNRNYLRGLCRDGRMEEISMPGNKMSCPLPAKSLVSLPRLQRIDLFNNSISGRYFRSEICLCRHCCHSPAVSNCGLSPSLLPCLLFTSPPPTPLPPLAQNRVYTRIISHLPTRTKSPIMDIFVNIACTRPIILLSYVH